MTDLIQKQRPILWFNLIGFNGMCWQSSGPIGAYKGFEPDDIFFFATELRPGIDDEAEILEDIENNPIPYMMLLSGANYPLTFHKKDQMVQVMSEFDLDEINTKELRKSFKTEYSNGVYRFTLERYYGTNEDLGSIIVRWDYDIPWDELLDKGWQVLRNLYRMNLELWKKRVK